MKQSHRRCSQWEKNITSVIFKREKKTSLFSWLSVYANWGERGYKRHCHISRNLFLSNFQLLFRVLCCLDSFVFLSSLLQRAIILQKLVSRRLENDNNFGEDIQREVIPKREAITITCSGLHFSTLFLFLLFYLESCIQLHISTFEKQEQSPELTNFFFTDNFVHTYFKSAYKIRHLYLFVYTFTKWVLLQQL